MSLGILDHFGGRRPMIEIHTGPGGPFTNWARDPQGRSGGGANPPPHARSLGAVSTVNYLPNSGVLMAPSPPRASSTAMRLLRTWESPMSSRGPFPIVATGDVPSSNGRDGAHCGFRSGEDTGRNTERGASVSVIQGQRSLRVRKTRQHNRGDQRGGDLTGHRSNRGVGEKGAVH